MSLVGSIQSPHESFDPIKLGSSADPSPRVTVLIGENGTGKSFLLRELATEAIALLSPETSKQAASGRIEFVRPPRKVIAISATPTDRFPSKSRAGEFFTKFDVDHYSYIGPRSSRNIISRQQSAFEFLNGVLISPGKLVDRRDFLLGILEQIGAPSRITVVLELSRVFSGAGFATFLGRIGTDPMLSHRQRRFGRVLSEFWSKYPTADLQRLDDGLQPFLTTLSSGRTRVRGKGVRIEIDLASGGFQASGISEVLLRLAIQTGYLIPRGIHFGEADHEYLSAGQWSIFATMFSLSMVIEDDTLVLVDEPENGLHPEWQRGYIDSILQAAGRATGCHYFIGTHSPMIVAAMSSENAELISMRRPPRGGNVEASVVSAPMGWNANAILEDKFGVVSARGPEITNLVDQALGLIARGIGKNRSKLLGIDSELERARNALPADDELLVTIDAIRASYRQQGVG